MTSHRALRPSPAPDCHRLVFALLPPVSVIARVHALLDMWATGCDRVAAGRLHVTAFVTEDHAELPPDIAARALRAAASSARSAVPIVLDQLLSKPGRILLRANETASAPRLFQRQLDADLRRAGISPRARYRFAPHCTLSYARDAPAIVRAIDPIGWTATELVLIHSLVGRTEHRILGRWSLTRGERQRGSEPYGPIQRLGNSDDDERSGRE